MDGRYSLLTLRACEAGARELNGSMWVEGRMPSGAGFKGAVISIGSKLGIKAPSGLLVEDIRPEWVTRMGVD